jgi:CBS domain-containing protein
MRCPDCDAEVILGQDQCLSCGTDLCELRVPPPRQGRLHELILEDPLSQLNAPEPICLHGEDTVGRAVDLMRRRRYGSVLVVDGTGKLSGILTERDLLTLDRGQGSMSELLLEDVMTTLPKTLREEDTIAHALNRMAVGGYRHLPILRDGFPVAFTSIRGILRYIAMNAL